MSVTMDDSIKRWTAKRKTALVVEIIQGKMTGGEVQARQIKLADEKIDDADEAVFTDPVVQPIQKKHRLATMNPTISASA